MQLFGACDARLVPGVAELKECSRVGVLRNRTSPKLLSLVRKQALHEKHNTHPKCVSTWNDAISLHKFILRRSTRRLWPFVLMKNKTLLLEIPPFGLLSLCRCSVS